MPMKKESGTLHRHANFPSRCVAPRHVDVWLPPGYATSGARYPVLYRHARRQSHLP